MAARPLPAAPAWLAGVRPALALAYLGLSHLATHRDSDALAALAVGVIVVLLLAERLWRRRPWAWAILGLGAVALWMLKDSGQVRVALLLMPVIFLAWFAWLFGRTLRPGHVPVIGKIVRALEGIDVRGLTPELERYTRGLTALWTAVFVAMAAINLGLALLATPGGLLARAGIAPPWPISDSQWSWFANWLNYGLVGAVFVIEFAYRKRRFPGRYKNAADFIRRMTTLEPAFWRDLFK